MVQIAEKGEKKAKNGVFSAKDSSEGKNKTSNLEKKR